VIDGARVYGGKHGAERAAERRARFIEAGLDLFGTQGVQATTLRAVLAQAGLGSRYFYELFESLEALQVAIVEHLLEDAQEVALEAIAQAGTRQRDRIRRVIAAMVDFVLDDPRKGRFLLVESLAAPAIGRHRLIRTDGLAAFVIAYGGGSAHHAGVRTASARATAHFLVNGFAGVMTAVLMGHIRMRRGALVDHLTELVRSGAAAQRQLDKLR
jgi:AcrR family transcriptional regulator